MAEAYIGEIRIFSGNFAPRGWAFCNGQLLPINQNQALFSILGTTYGGDGRQTFALPDLRGRVPMHFGQGMQLGQSQGVERVQLVPQEIPVHVHGVGASSSPADSTAPAERVAGVARVPTYADGSSAPMAQPLAAAGGNQAHENMAPFLSLSFIIALQGIFPPRG